MGHMDGTKCVSCNLLTLNSYISQNSYQASTGVLFLHMFENGKFVKDVTSHTDTT